ncbi:helix-turn-helix transcriptional regulator [Moritella sp. F3]|jgi:phage repressor protein C with HTH and peptisase S24 domain/DNA-binding Xre family transcriptional regulator|uniref:LexA family transcriptional regulator n=1 Tax=Moritella sp. F3 TaxID=2718882 RepID=UPI0018E127C6|nr:helix-turn-helix transcriptional regulator [Moritella sp. F3]GIC79473.1 hypothetical protein FMO001_42000 [Moritella sp. F1]GIC79751.1 hypothetical protein FMO003_00320 [Moritella sp. F3]
MSTTVGLKIKSIREAEGLTRSQLSDLIGISTDTLAQYETGRIKAIGLEKLDKIINHDRFHKYALWLISEKTEPEVGQISPNDTLNNVYTHTKEKHIKLPFYEISASAGVGLLAEVEECPKSISFEPNWLRNDIGVSPSNVFLMLVDGDSMQPTLKNGSMIMVNRDVDNLSDGVYVMRHDNNLLVKRLQMLPGGIIRVKSDNTMYDPWEITKSQLDGEELALIGRVVWTGQKM